ncbi:receptor-type tyrosine-protein phosphatase eta [Toxotes jaculatrix]|uniref:receptor-type tyrosine-protein phosphatase eta n=1 Tax=Toxotes jaculatrix TaxID=941984 RepID=UPI001B3AF7C5|nr:receptor-type tyrosine-protein phosphatase eta [Toxotes jaculatrix]
MRRLSLHIKVCILITLVLMWTCGVAEREYFPQARNLTWDEARNHCQICFKDLVTLTPDNTQGIARNLSSDHWIGLRKNFYSTFNSTVFWTRWANGDPLAFQNWYPGWPVFKSPPPKQACCSCSCTCPATTPAPATTSLAAYTEFISLNTTSEFGDFMTENVTDSSIFTTTGQNLTNNTTHMDFTAECVRSPMLPPDVPETDENYIEDSCVAMLSFGAWVEKNCSELLPFICYEDRFFGQANVTNVTTGNATLSWLMGPGNISHYRVEVRGDITMTLNLTNLTYDLLNLTAGTRYSVHVFPVKCDRDLNPQEVTFYTIPNKVTNLAVTKVTETSVFLAWTKSDGNVSFYVIKVNNTSKESYNENAEVHGLIPGNLYTFVVHAEVQDRSRQSEESTISAYTKPGKVSNLSVSENTNTSLLLTWDPPEGNAMAFRVVAMDDSDNELFNNGEHSSTQTQQEVTGLPMGTRITLSVTALVNGTLEGDNVTVVNYTVPEPISNLTLKSTNNTLNATWIHPGNYSSFTVHLKLGDQIVCSEHGLTQLNKSFYQLKNSANYTVIVYTVSGHLQSPPVEKSKFTLPSPPTDVSVSSSNTTQITFQWKPPEDAGKVTYFVSLNSSFWGYNKSLCVKETSHMFGDLASGTKYSFQVRTMADESRSEAENCSHYTDAEKMEISLSMLCSSSEALHCANGTVKETVFNKLMTYFESRLGDSIFWRLQKKESEKSAT